jgi:Leucine-rich repeat (LRR) protein
MKRILLIICITASLLACGDTENAAPDLNVIPSIIEFSHTESTRKVYIGSNTSWIASSNEEWCVVSRFQNHGNDTLEITVPANTDYYERIAYVAVKNTEETVIKTIKVIQQSLGRYMFRKDDSMALVRFYDLTGGDRWTNNRGWKISNLETWHGIAVNNDRVTGIKMKNNNLSGELIPELVDLTMLDTLSIVEEKGVTGVIPATIADLHNLLYLNISGTSIEGDIPPVLGDMDGLEELILSENFGFTGTIPQELGKLENLKKLVINNLSARGNIPAELGNLHRLKYLALDSCTLNYIPSEIFGLTDLEYLSLNNCKIQAPFPSNIIILTKLKHLILSRNYFFGTIPPELADLELQTLHLDHNYLNGDVPEAIIAKIDGDLFKLCPQIAPSFFNNYSCYQDE